MHIQYDILGNASRCCHYTPPVIRKFLTGPATRDFLTWRNETKVKLEMHFLNEILDLFLIVTAFLLGGARRGDFMYTTVLFSGISHQFVCASGEAILGTEQCTPKDVLINCFRAFGETIVGTQRYFSKQFLVQFVSRLRRGDFRYTTIRCKAVSY